MSLRTPLARVLGLGSARAGTEQWWMERVTSVALVPLTLWFVIALLSLPSLDYDTVHSWLAAPFSGFLAILFTAVAAYHSFLGTTVIVEDYVHGTGVKVATMLALRFAHVLVGGAAIFAILRISMAPLTVATGSTSL